MRRLHTFLLLPRLYHTYCVRQQVDVISDRKGQGASRLLSRSQPRADFLQRLHDTSNNLVHFLVGEGTFGTAEGERQRKAARAFGNAFAAVDLKHPETMTASDRFWCSSALWRPIKVGVKAHNL